MTTVSKDLAIALCVVITKIYNVGCQIYFEKKESTCVIEGRTVNQHDNYMVRFRLNSKKHLWFIENNIVWNKVKKIEKTNNSQLIYDLNIKEHNSYTVNNIITTN